MVEQYDIYWTKLDPTQGGEMAKTRPCVVISPTGLNKHLKTVIVIPITSTIRNVSFRVHCFLSGREGEIAVDQIRSIDKGRLKRKIDKLSNKEIDKLREVLNEMFCL